MSRRKVSLVVAGALVAVVAASGIAWWGGLFDELLGDDDPQTALDVPPPEGLELPDALDPRPVLPAAKGPAVSTALLRDRVEPLLGDTDLGRHVGFAAYDLTHDRTLWTYGGHNSFIPASTLKLFTTTAALEVMGGDHVFTTSSVLAAEHQGGGAPEVVLVGGGDPLLASRLPRGDVPDPAPATLADLAAETARLLAFRGISRVSVGYDVSRYDGPADSPDWESSYVPDEVPPISPLWADEGADPDDPYDFSLDPAGLAAETFATELEKRGVKVVGAMSEASGDGGQSLAAVDSAPLRDIVGHILDLSDNAGAEILLREVAIATGHPASFAGGAEAVRQVLAGLGVPMQGVKTYDGSGLSRSNRVTLDAMLTVLRLASDDEHPELRDAVSQLSVAGFTGTLAFRFVDGDAAAGLGWVRAKTGTLSNVHGLAGTTVDRDGVAIAFVALVDQVPLQDTLDARSILDDIAAAVSRCGCAA
ncbi:MAG TPA: D-alanyl-D-alanine carboxypeptidase/D-alanyl-D-alanine-endopeptidase [Nocardioidaceae bacterium]|nr:D-alanyl-D-alanine carboxypeptidase/D-alanyl-D-alanine-endopeptidase [Nocardioidaceae bacterium]